MSRKTAKRQRFYTEQRLMRRCRHYAAMYKGFDPMAYHNIYMPRILDELWQQQRPQVLEKFGRYRLVAPALTDEQVEALLQAYT